MDIQVAVQMLESNPDFRVLRRLRVDENHVFSENTTGEKLGRLAVIDTETTGLNAEAGDRIIDLAIATCEYGRDSGTLYRVIDRYESLEDPEFPISPEITKLTGITDAMVKGHRIDEAGMARVLGNVNLVICHNAGFDRPFLEARYPVFAEMHFGCSLHDIPWNAWSLNSSKLDYLGFRFGLFNDAHRARADIDMLIAVLAHQAPASDQSILSILLSNARTPSWRIYAMGLAFEHKDIAKMRGYRWSDGKFGTPKAWVIDTKEEDAELKFLVELGCRHPSVTRLTAKERYRPLASYVQPLE